MNCFSKMMMFILARKFAEVKSWTVPFEHLRAPPDHQAKQKRGVVPNQQWRNASIRLSDGNRIASIPSFFAKNT